MNIYFKSQIWTAVLSGIIVIYGTVILGVQSPTGKYYQCCSGNVHRLTPMSLGAFGGSLMMFANLTLVCAILFGEFEVRCMYKLSTRSYLLMWMLSYRVSLSSSPDKRLCPKPKRQQQHWQRGGSNLLRLLHNVHILHYHVCLLCWAIICQLHHVVGRKRS
jgi:hypothetical protein